VVRGSEGKGEVRLRRWGGVARKGAEENEEAEPEEGDEGEVDGVDRGEARR
jgi:hypothetical protein